MHDLRDKLVQAGVPEPNRAERRKAEAMVKLGKALDPRPEEPRTAIEAPKPERIVERTSKGVRTIRCGPPRKS